MNSLKIFFMFMLLISSLALMSHGSKTSSYEDDIASKGDETYETDTYQVEDDDLVPLRGIGRFLAQKKSSSRVSALTTCDKYPKICRVKGSPGRDCCSKKCVDTKTDRLNCGKCGKKCKYSEICCKGKCVNPMNDKKHCGGCNNSCSRLKKGKCVYGICNYA